MVLDEVWRRIEGVEALSGPQGGPLSRTVKLILDPLVVRPVQHPACAGPVVTAEGAALLATRIRSAAPALRATAEWFTLFKQVRRASRITEGNPQDLYFQRCFELATTRGRPDPLRGRQIAEDVLREVHATTAGRTTAALERHLASPERRAELESLLAVAWSRRPLADPSTTDFAPRLRTLLDVCAAARLADGRDDGRKLAAALSAERAGTHTGIRLWSGTAARDLGLTEYAPPQRPSVGASASTATLALPFDRTVYERVFTVLQASTDRADLPPVPELVAAEVARGCAPWALLDESLRLTAAAGAALAVGLSPLGTDDEPEALALRVIHRRWRREAYVLRARRLTVCADEAAAGALAAVAAELRTPWRPYLRRLWVRLHGRDVREFALEVDELWDLIDGVARSVLLDHRMRVKQALAADTGAAEPDSLDSRAS
ncbi:hypothetical protein ACWDSJ_12515 [Nocardia sp. NPDC003482]